MTISLMQPYLFPYPGYFQLMKAADKFVLYDDVAFRRGGWINRNRLLDPSTGVIWYFTLPVKNASPHRAINELEIGGPARWQDQLLRRFCMCYSKARNFKVVCGLVETIVLNPDKNLAVVLRDSLHAVRDLLGIDTPIIASSAIYENRCLARTSRVIDIVQREGGTVYLNAEGGRTLYAEADFREAGLELRFLEHRDLAYAQLGEGGFQPRLSVLDALLHCSPECLRTLLSSYTIV